MLYIILNILLKYGLKCFRDWVKYLATFNEPNCQVNPHHRVAQVPLEIALMGIQRGSDDSNVKV